MFQLAISIIIIFALTIQTLPFFASANPVQAATPTLEPIEDAFVGTGGSGYGDPDRNNGDDTELSVGYESGVAITTRSFIKWNLSGIPSGATINSATLSVYVTGWSSGSTRIVAIAHPNSNWSENTIKWNNMPSTGDAITSGSLTGIGRHTFDVTDAVNDWVDGSRSNYGVVLQSSSEIVWLGSKEAPSSWRPRLIIDYDVPLPDLRVFTGLNASPMSVNAGSDTILNFSIENDGSQTITSALYIRSYLSTDSTITTGDSYLEQLTINEDLSPGEGFAITSWPVTIPQDTFATGDYYIGVILDPSDNIEEIDENNNTKYAYPFHVESRPDLTVASVSAQPAEVTAGTDELEVTYNIQNIGYGSAGSLNNKIVLSEDTTIGDGDDIDLMTFSVSSLLPGSSVGGTQNPTVPSYVEGYYYVGVIADTGGAIPEIPGANNTGRTSTTIEVVPPKTDIKDVEVTSVEVSDTTPCPGDTITINYVVMNNGTVDTNIFTNSSRWSTNSNIDLGDTELNNKDMLSISSGSSRSDSMTITIPSGAILGQIYYIGVYADSGDVIAPETSDSNNGMSTQITIQCDATDQIGSVALSGDAEGIVYDLSVDWNEAPLGTLLTGAVIAGDDATHYVSTLSETSSFVPALVFLQPGSLPILLTFELPDGSLVEETHTIDVPYDLETAIEIGDDIPLGVFGDILDGLPGELAGYGGLLADAYYARETPGRMLDTLLSEGLSLVYGGGGGTLMFVIDQFSYWMIIRPQEDFLPAEDYEKLNQEGFLAKLAGSWILVYEYTIDWVSAGWNPHTREFQPAISFAPPSKISFELRNFEYRYLELSQKINDGRQAISDAFKDFIEFLVHSPVDISIIGPYGGIFIENSSDIPYSFYCTSQDLNDNHLIEHFRIYKPESGEYRIITMPKSSAKPTDTYSLEVIKKGQTTVLADHIRISDIPSEGYVETYDAETPLEPTIRYTPSILNFVATKGGQNPPAKTLNIWNSGTGTIAWSVTGHSWLDLSPPNGASTGETDTVTVSVDISDMTAGDYSTTIVISALGASNSPQMVPVDLTINPAAGPGITWNCPLGGVTLIAPNPGAGRPFLTVAADPGEITASAGAELWGIYYLDETVPGGEWLYYIPGFIANTLTQLEPDQYYYVVVSRECSLTIPQ